MKYASSIRYGGELIEAKNCDYESYKHLGLLCPECKDPVFLKAEGLRSLKDKDVRVTTHFSHFPGKDAALILACENRIKAYSKEELEHKANQSRGQRLKTIQRWFYEIIKCSPLFKEGMQKAEQLDYSCNNVDDEELSRIQQGLFERDILILCEHIKQGKLKEAVNKEIENFFYYADDFKNSIQELRKGTISDLKMTCLMIDFGVKTPEELSVLAGFTKIDRQMQKLICCEILDFLATLRARPILTEVFLSACALSEFAHCYEIPDDVRSLYEWTSNPGTTSYVCQIITQVLWQAEFEKMNSLPPRIPAR